MSAALDHLRRATVSDDGLMITLAPGQLDRTTYQAVSTALEALGGKWNRKARAHVFPHDVRRAFTVVLDGSKVPPKNPLAFYATPGPLVHDLLKNIWPISPDARVLEPSAGTGALVTGLLRASVRPGQIHCCEIDADRRAHLEAAGHTVVAPDFLAYVPEQPYDVIVMNPPFTAPDDKHAYIAHIRHAWDLLAPGGSLAAIAPAGFTYASKRPGSEFRIFVEAHGLITQTNPPEAFKDSGASVQTVHLLLQKPFNPQEDAMTVSASTARKPHTPKTKAAGPLAAPAPEAQEAVPVPAITPNPYTVGDQLEFDFAEVQGEPTVTVVGVVIAVIEPYKDQEAQVTLDHQGWSITRPISEVRPAPIKTAVDGAVPVTTTVDAAPAPFLQGSKVRTTPLHSLVASPLNPRKHFEESSIAELAESIAHKGLMQNLVVRLGDQPNSYEVIAGGRRLRALRLLEQSGRLAPDYEVPVRLAALTDLEALQLATAENVERRSMTPLEEADAFAKMLDLGATAEDIALRFGYNRRTVEQRLVLAHDLGDEARELLNTGRITLGQAQVIAQTSGPLRKHVLESARRGDPATTLRHMIQRGSFLVGHAKFDVTASGLDIVEDLFGDTPARFADPQAALALQLDWVTKRAETLRAKGKHHFVEVVAQDREHLSLPYNDYDAHTGIKDLAGTVLLYSTVTGEVREQGGVVREVDKRARQQSERAKTRAKEASVATGSEGGAIRKAAWLIAHEARAASVRQALLGDHKRSVALVILGLLGAESVKISLDTSSLQGAITPAVTARLQALDTRLGGLLKVREPGSAWPISREHFSGGGMWGDKRSKAEFKLLDQLCTLELDELLDLLSILTACTVGNWNIYSPDSLATPFLTELAKTTGARPELRLTDEYLKAYTKDRLFELAGEAGLAYIANNTGRLNTSKEVRAAILAHADELHANGFVPAFVQFGNVKGA